jgi:hypothetical protein
MRRFLTKDKLDRFMKELARLCTGAGRVYFTGGTTALLLGIREQTIDIDLKFDPEPQGAFEAIPILKKDLQINVELAAPDDFIPVPDNWRERSLFIAKIGELEFYNFDICSQALAKLERGHSQDLVDVKEFIRRGYVTVHELGTVFDCLRVKVIRYPALDLDSFEAKVKNFIDGLGDNRDEK